MTASATLQRNLAWRYPEWWTVALSSAAWAGLATQALIGEHHHGLLANWLHWMLMVAAMMLPLTLDAVRTTAACSLWARRHRAVLGFHLGYLTPWALAGFLLATLASQFSERVSWITGAAIAFFIAALWETTHAKLVAAARCHRTMPLSPRGWRADRDCLRYGWHSGLNCSLNCWPFMLACWLSGHSFLVMACTFPFGIAERYRRSNQRLRAGLLAALAFLFGAFAFFA